MKIFSRLATLAAWTLVATASYAQDVHTLILMPSKGFYEVLPGANTGGRLVNHPYWVNGLTVAGYTDRAQRGENVGLMLEGPGVFTRFGTKSNGRVLFQLFNTASPSITGWVVPTNPAYDNIMIFAEYYGRYFEKRLPVGTRP